MERPQKPYFDLFDEKGIRYERKDNVLTVEGRLTPGEYRLPGNVSSQFFTGLLLALPLEEGRPFPLEALFCLGRIQRVEGRRCVIYAFREEEPVLWREG